MREINRANKLERRDAQLRDKAESRRQAEEARVRDADQRKQLLFKPGDMIYKSGDVEVCLSFVRPPLSHTHRHDAIIGSSISLCCTLPCIK